MTRHLDRLPQGYFYNGRQFVDIFGEKMTFHPCILFTVDGRNSTTSDRSLRPEIAEIFFKFQTLKKPKPNRIQSL